MQQTGKRTYFVMSLTSVTASNQPSIIIAGECVVSTICTCGLRLRIRPMSFCCHSICRLASGSSRKST